MAKTYSVPKSCTAAFAPKKCSLLLGKFRENSIINYGLSESGDKDLDNRVEKVLVELGDKPVVKNCLRLGLQKETVVPPSSCLNVFRFFQSCCIKVM